MTFEELATAIGTVGQSRRVIVCPAGESLKIEALVQRYDMGRWWRVHESALCPEGTVILINDPGTGRTEEDHHAR